MRICLICHVLQTLHTIHSGTDGPVWLPYEYLYLKRLNVHMVSLVICESREASMTFCQKMVIFVLIKCASCHKYGADLESRVCYLKRNICSIIQAMTT